MPTETKRDEEKWSKAKALAKEQGQAENYAYIMGIYKKMNPDYEFKSGPDAKKASLLNAPDRIPALYATVQEIILSPSPGGPNVLRTSDGGEIYFVLGDGPRVIQAPSKEASMGPVQKLASKWLSRMAADPLFYPEPYSADDDDGSYEYAHRIWLMAQFDKKKFPSPADAQRWDKILHNRAALFVKKNLPGIQSIVDEMVITTAGGRGLMNKPMKAGEVTIKLEKARGGGYSVSLYIDGIQVFSGFGSGMAKAVEAFKKTLHSKYGLTVQ